MYGDWYWFIFEQTTTKRPRRRQLSPDGEIFNMGPRSSCESLLIALFILRRTRRTGEGNGLMCVYLLFLNMLQGLHINSMWYPSPYPHLHHRALDGFHYHIVVRRCHWRYSESKLWIIYAGQNTNGSVYFQILLCTKSSSWLSLARPTDGPGLEYNLRMMSCTDKY